MNYIFLLGCAIIFAFNSFRFWMATYIHTYTLTDRHTNCLQIFFSFVDFSPHTMNFFFQKKKKFEKKFVFRLSLSVFSKNNKDTYTHQMSNNSFMFNEKKITYYKWIFFSLSLFVHFDSMIIVTQYFSMRMLNRQFFFLLFLLRWFWPYCNNKKK